MKSLLIFMHQYACLVLRIYVLYLGCPCDILNELLPEAKLTSVG